MHSCMCVYVRMYVCMYPVHMYCNVQFPPLQKTVSDLQKEISEQRQKQDRVMRQTNKLQKEIRAKKGALEATAEEVSRL